MRSKKTKSVFPFLFTTPLLFFSLSCVQRNVYFQESPLPETAIFDAKFSQNSPLQKAILEIGFKKIKSDLLAISQLFSVSSETLVRTHTDLPQEFVSIKESLDNYTQNSEFFGKLLKNSLSNSAVNHQIFSGLYSRFVEKLSMFSKMFTDFFAKTSNNYLTFSKEELLTFLEQTRTQFIGIATEVWLRLQPLVSKWNNLVSSWAESEEAKTSKIPISAVGWTSFTSLDSNFTLPNVNYLIKTLPLIKSFGDWNFLVSPHLALADYFEFLRNFLPEILGAYQKMDNFGVALKSTVFLLASFIVGVQQSFGSVETQLKLIQPSPVKIHPKLSAKIKTLSDTLQARKHFTNAHSIFSTIHNNFREYLKSFKELLPHFGTIKTVFAELEEKLWGYHFNVHKSFFTLTQKEVLEASLLELMTKLELTDEPKPLPDHITLTVTQVFKNLESMISGATSDSQPVLEHKLTQLLETLEKEVEWLDGAGFSNLEGLSQLLQSVNLKKTAIILLLDEIIQHLTTLSKNFLDIIKHLSLIGILLERLKRQLELPQETIEQLSTSLNAFFKEGLWSSYSKLLVLIQGPNFQKNLAASESSSTHSLKNLQDFSAQDNIFFWINNFRNSYLAISSLLEYSFIELEELFYQF